MAANEKEDQKWSDQKKVEEVSLRTVDSLRGRLLAERQASRIAKQDAQLLGNKLVELENKLREETQLRQKAEKKLKILMKKLQSLKISPTFQGLELQSTSSEICGSSCSSTSSTSSPNQHPQQSLSKSQLPQHSLDSNPNLEDCQDSKPDSQSGSNSGAETVEMEKDKSNKEENVDKYSLALVPVSVKAATTESSTQLIIANKSVSEVLDALRHAREEIQNSLERGRHVTRVGPT